MPLSRQLPAPLLAAALSCQTLSAAPLRVACVGASITQGVGASPGHGYVSVLGRLLGPGYEVRNFGVSGRTLLTRGDAPWIREPACAEALACDPQLVLIDLGGNDSKPQNWAHRDEFKADYAALMARFASLPSRPRIYCLLPVPAFPENYGIRDSVIATEVIPLIREVAAEHGAGLIDLHTPLLGSGADFPDKVHPNDHAAAGMAMVAYSVLTTPVNPASNALQPVPKLEEDSYDWYQRHAAELALGQHADPQVVTLGDSITHFWGGEPAGQATAPQVWDELFAGIPVMNLGFGWDRTQNALWRLDHGEFAGLHPQLVMLHIGTNNLTGTEHARESTPPEIAEAIWAIICRLRASSPFTQVLLLGIFPRGEQPDDPFRAKIRAVNALLAPLGTREGITYLDLADRFLEPDGHLPAAVMADATHPTAEGYRRWAEAVRPLVRAAVRR